MARIGEVIFDGLCDLLTEEASEDWCVGGNRSSTPNLLFESIKPYFSLISASPHPFKYLILDVVLLIIAHSSPHHQGRPIPTHDVTTFRRGEPTQSGAGNDCAKKLRTMNRQRKDKEKEKDKEKDQDTQLHHPTQKSGHHINVYIP